MACLLLAAGIAGYLGWLLWGTGIATQRAQNELRSTFTHLIDSKPPTQAPPPGQIRLPGSAYAELVIPAIHFDMIVVNGTDEESLKRGPGHYTNTADPWDKTGRVGIAGHRTTYLHPFWSLDRVHFGDTITLRTEYGTFVYRVNRPPFAIQEAGSGVVLHPTVQPTLVLTTCNPKYASYQRLIVTADRVTSSAS